MNRVSLPSTAPIQYRRARRAGAGVRDTDLVARGLGAHAQEVTPAPGVPGMLLRFGPRCNRAHHAHLLQSDRAASLRADPVSTYSDPSQCTHVARHLHGVSAFAATRCVLAPFFRALSFEHMIAFAHQSVHS